MFNRFDIFIELEKKLIVINGRSGDLIRNLVSFFDNKRDSFDFILIELIEAFDLFEFDSDISQLFSIGT